ncbi:hypothetical protein BK127_39860 [Paenibacillus sp. FSL H7-0331]|nr:hypothetical protein BK127_39860 [Paenibacillus sp. FSL H7-0331]
MNNPSYNPFNDETVHLTLKLTQSNIIDERDAFNDVIKHGDSVQGFRAPKKIEQFPKWYQNSQRIYGTISVLVFASFMIYRFSKLSGILHRGSSPCVYRRQL